MRYNGFFGAPLCTCSGVARTKDQVGRTSGRPEGRSWITATLLGGGGGQTQRFRASEEEEEARCAAFPPRTKVKRLSRFSGGGRLSDLFVRKWDGRGGGPNRGQPVDEPTASENVQPPLALTRLTQIRRSPAPPLARLPQRRLPPVAPMRPPCPCLLCLSTCALLPVLPWALLTPARCRLLVRLLLVLVRQAFAAMNT